MKRTLERPEMAADALYQKTDISPEQFFQALARLRKEAAAEIERLIDWLDANDQYTGTELEDAVDDGPIDTDELERSFCGVSSSGEPAKGFHGDDEMEADDGGREADREPSLGSVGDHGFWPGQVYWAQGVTNDTEDEHDGAEPEDEGDDNPDREPLLGWTEDGCMNTSELEEGTTSAEDLQAARQRFAEGDAARDDAVFVNGRVLTKAVQQAVDKVERLARRRPGMRSMSVSNLTMLDGSPVDLRRV